MRFYLVTNRFAAIVGNRAIEFRQRSRYIFRLVRRNARKRQSSAVLINRRSTFARASRGIITENRVVTRIRRTIHVRHSLSPFPVIGGKARFFFVLWFGSIVVRLLSVCKHDG